MALGTGALARLGGMLASAAVVSAASSISRRAMLSSPRQGPDVRADQQGFMHVRTAGPETGPVVVLVHAGRRRSSVRNWIEPLVEKGTESSYPISSVRVLRSARRAVHPGVLLGGIVVAEFAAENPGEVASVALMSPAGLGKSHVVDPVLLTPLIGDWMFRVLGPTWSLVTSPPRMPDRQDSTLCWIG